jgi:putative transcriptional regulator
MLGEHKLKITDVARATGIDRGTLTRLYHETAEKYDREVLDTLCRFFGCQPGDLFEHVQDPPAAPAADPVEG